MDDLIRLHAGGVEKGGRDEASRLFIYTGIPPGLGERH